MRFNQDTTISGDTVVLVPYKPEHVLRYHAWMEDPILRAATASERLTLEEEYEMQRSWAQDEDKLTFILLDRTLPDLEGMCGDVNLYLNDAEDRRCAEIEIMVAEPKSRRKGIAREALTMMITYATQHLSIRRFVAKIGVSNVASQRLFMGLGFVESGRSVVFQEITFERCMDNNMGLCGTNPTNY